jgi:glycosyltransferase involved in cell wall biosynthesis
MATPEPERCAVIAPGSREAAQRAAHTAGLEPIVVLTKADCATELRDVRRRMRHLGVRTLAIHSDDWSREHMPQFYEVAAARLGMPECRIVGSDGSVELRLGGLKLATRLARLPLEFAGGFGLAGAEAVHFRRMRDRAGARPRGDDNGRENVVLALWLGPGPGTNVGGAVTHVSGVLGGFRSAGLRVALVTVDEPAPQVREVIDDLVRIPPMPRYARVTADVTAVASNRFARSVIERAAAMLRPAFIYQRNDTYVTAGVEVGRRVGIPVVLEWNSSLVWTRTNWNELRRLNRMLLPLLTAAESYVATHADVVAAVSQQAARMAIEVGAPPERVAVVPNAVDMRAIDAGRALARPRRDRDVSLVGWVGSFGPWHGAPVLVEAVRLLPSWVQAVMIGDGNERHQCEALARRLGVWDRIEWTGALPHVETVRLLAGCDVLASPHVPLDGQAFFGSPTKLFEYMAIGRPIVASALEQLGEVLEDRRTARLVQPNDPVELARAIEELLREPDRGHRLGAAARAEAQNAHRWEDRAGTILERLAMVQHRASSSTEADRASA